MNRRFLTPTVAAAVLATGLTGCGVGDSIGSSDQKRAIAVCSGVRFRTAS